MRRFVLFFAFVLACELGPTGDAALAGAPPRPNVDPPVTLPAVIPDLSGSWEFHGLSQASKPSLWFDTQETRTRVSSDAYSFHRVVQVSLIDRRRVGQMVIDGTQSFAGGKLCETATSVRWTLEPWAVDGQTDLGERVQKTYSPTGWKRFPCKVIQAVTTTELTYTDGGVRGTERRPLPPPAAAQPHPPAGH